MASVDCGSPLKHVDSPRKCTIDEQFDDESDDDFDKAAKPSKKDGDALVLFDAAVQVDAETMAPSAPPLLMDDVEASAPLAIDSPQAAVVYVAANDDLEAPVPVASRAHKTPRIQTGQWKIGYCSCMSVCAPTCIMATCCQCFPLAQIAGRMGMVPYWYAIGFFGLLMLALMVLMSLGAVTFTDAAIRPAESMSSNMYMQFACIINVIYMFAIWQLRVKIRERFQIPGSSCGDCCAGCMAAFCFSTCCVISQMAAHIEVYKPKSFDFGPVDVLPAYECAPHSEA